MGSVIVIDDPLLSPAGLGDAGYFPRVHEFPQTYAAKPELAVHRPRPPAAAAARVSPHLELGLSLLLLD
jgi:hypothetical protein